MSQLEELQVFVRERLHAATSEILGAVVKAVTDYEEQAVRLKEENHRNRSLLDIILKAQATHTEAGRAKKHTPVTAAGPDASDSIPARKARETPRCSSDLQRVFTSRTDFLKFAGNGNCPYCLRRNQATEKHLMKKHYLPAVHFTEHGTQKFIVPCLCKYLIKGRSHWHCSYCSSILTRKGNFELHLTKQHACTILLQSQDAEIYQPAVSVIEEEVPLSPEPGYQQEFSSLDQETQQAAPLLQVKEEEWETCRRVSHPGWQNSEQLQIEGEQIQKGNSQTSLEADNADIVVMDSYIQDLGEINSVENGKTHPHSSSSNQHLETQLNSGVGGIRHPAGESQHTTPCSSLKALDTKRKARGKRKKSSPPSSLNTKKSTQLSISQNPAGPHRCKACGKTFHYMYTLRTHAQTHAMDKLHICGICGKRSESRQSLVQHLQSHTKRNKCDICGKQFSNNSRLEQHRRFHRPKGLNVMSSA